MDDRLMINASDKSMCVAHPKGSMNCDYIFLRFLAAIPSHQLSCRHWHRKRKCESRKNVTEKKEQNKRMKDNFQTAIEVEKGNKAKAQNPISKVWRGEKSQKSWNRRQRRRDR